MRDRGGIELSPGDLVIVGAKLGKTMQNYLRYAVVDRVFNQFVETIYVEDQVKVGLPTRRQTIKSGGNILKIEVEQMPIRILEVLEMARGGE